MLTKTPARRVFAHLSSLPAARGRGFPSHPITAAGCALVLLASVAGCQGRPDRTAAPRATDGTPATPVAAQPAARPPTAPPSSAPLASAAANSQIKRVTVFSDRARVTRATTVQLRGAQTHFEFDKLPGWVDDGTVRVATSDGRILDVKVKRDFLARSTDAHSRAARDAVQELAMQDAMLQDELQILAAQAAQIQAIKAFSLEAVSKETTIRGASVESYGKVVEFISTSLRETARARRDAERKRRELGPELEASKKRLAELEKLTQLEETSVLVTLEGPTGSSANLELTYMIPGATWEPAHELRAGGAQPDTVEVTSYAVVTQTTGEDWSDAEITFSTQSTTNAVRIPELEALTLGDTHTASRVVKSRVSSFTRAQTAFQKQNRLWNKARQESSSSLHNFEQVYEGNLDYLQVVQGKTVDIFKTLQERGTTALFKGEGLATVRSDGHSARLRIGRAKLEASQQIVAAPEQSMNAANTLRSTNTSPQPILPGKVALYRDGAFLGMTDLEFIAQGEEFSLFLGVADHIKLSRVLDRKQSSLVRKQRNRMHLVFVVTVENLSSKETGLSLADRVPVSENKDIKIDKVSISPSQAPDSKGLVRWDLKLAPKAKQTFRVAYRIDYPPSLVLRTRPGEKAVGKRKPKARLRYKIGALEDAF